MGWVTRLVSCAWEIKEDLLEEGTARTNAQRLERPGTSKVGTPRLHSESKGQRRQEVRSWCCQGPCWACQGSVRPLVVGGCLTYIQSLIWLGAKSAHDIFSNTEEYM